MSESTQSDLSRSEFVENWPTDASAEVLLDELLFQRAVQSYLWALPAMNVVAMKEGSERLFGVGYNVMPIWRGRLNPATLVTTPNSDVVYAMAFLDLQKDGPMVVEVGPGLQGILDDFWQRPLTGPLTDSKLGVPSPDGKRWFGDVGLVGPDEGKGGTYVILAPDYDDEEPTEGYVYRSRTSGIFVFWRSFFQDPTDLSKPVAALEQSRIYPLGKKDQAKPMQFPEGSGVPADLLFTRDSSYFDMLARFIDHEYVDPTDMDMRGMLASIGIVKGQPFEPDEKTRAMLDRAALTAFKMSKAMASHAAKDMPGGTQWDDRQYMNPFMGGSPFFYEDSYTNIDNRTVYFTDAYSLSPAMALNFVGMGPSTRSPCATPMVSSSWAHAHTRCTCHRTSQPSCSGRSRRTTPSMHRGSTTANRCPRSTRWTAPQRTQTAASISTSDRRSPLGPRTGSPPCPVEATSSSIGSTDRISPTSTTPGARTTSSRSASGSANAMRRAASDRARQQTITMPVTLGPPLVRLQRSARNA